MPIRHYADNGSNGMQADHAELSDTMQPEHCMPMFLVFNLFSLEALHIAECLCIPCLAVSPCLVPYTFPTSFPRRFRQEWPDLYTRLQTRSSGESLFLLLCTVFLLLCQVPYPVWPPLLEVLMILEQTIAHPAGSCQPILAAVNHSYMRCTYPHTNPIYRRCPSTTPLQCSCTQILSRLQAPDTRTHPALCLLSFNL